MHGDDCERQPLAPSPVPLPCALALPRTSHQNTTMTSPCWASHFVTQESRCLMFSKPTPSELRLVAWLKLEDALGKKSSISQIPKSSISQIPHGATNCEYKRITDFVFLTTFPTNAAYFLKKCQYRLYCYTLTTTRKTCRVTGLGLTTAILLY